MSFDSSEPHLLKGGSHTYVMGLRNLRAPQCCIDATPGMQQAIHGELLLRSSAILTHISKMTSSFLKDGDPGTCLCCPPDWGCPHPA